MNITPVNNLLLTTTTPSIERLEQPKATFTSWMEEKISETNNQLNAADEALTQLASGHAENLHQTMITLEQAKLSFQYLEQIRNRLMSAYQELLREQI
ncbi:flagellar hook-basal body complex protein FliE [Legionella bononiensis]|uniref:Flagellar hook-basal body complex protein FliE n=1 Tax=Legionella bononiensis TaxID=2793102 RepID=A0ABS1WD55_9GAMM|nr:flagellar hook-basal body complex protein FliE [Legionella bononiensis]MBL7479154.1 flagellar hook-basal body complex protein FliE [Legionella bononiensis]MBL7527287.1 flagellar hook-basal body complex protein FliE [Legionella bononiensis]MBL7562256.1 flagellar hook-basal body complex protein FliE [Legionella bononiensis]